ncbi:Ig-like domain-containing protein [Kangiella shandongensis]|uniref:Ig-like domain-containing protein n=1 Tax=Kangiella shandongensis TaxID=2763258 RepID=UPI001CC0F5D6|nr:Ig-like domain-containing protein [Kangiella shandongensis]
MKIVNIYKLAAMSSLLLLIGCSDDTEPDINQAPVTTKATVVTETDTPVMDQLQADDADGDSLTFNIVAEPQSGSVELGVDGNFTYTPAKEFTGSDIFTFVASDGSLNSAVTDVEITVNVKEEVFSSYSRKSYSNQSNDEPSGVNGRQFIFDVTTTTTYQDLVQDGNQ